MKQLLTRKIGIIRSIVPKMAQKTLIPVRNGHVNHACDDYYVAQTSQLIIRSRLAKIGQSEQSLWLR